MNGLNGYRLLADGWRSMAERGKVSQEEASKKCKALDFLAECCRDDIYNLWDAGAFNEIAGALVGATCTELADEGIITDDLADKFRERAGEILTETGAKRLIDCVCYAGHGWNE